ncbi:DNA-(apurinic or apyrimidinic site) endonuclease 2-like [Oratosquilla oratoria]|uniref:DNA-(apurinic or apyrimidinic site) endonuclease 2-like n=1 Tax=Oratosquilla oratoria TaxID=337810 RepID=UPI003F771026
MPFKILSWNINGLRSLKTDIREILLKLDASVICFQETKVTRDMLEERIAIVEGFSSYFSFSRNRRGYSGVATYCTTDATPTHAQEGLSGIFGSSLPNETGSTESLPGEWSPKDLKVIDSEGRAVITQHSFKTEEDQELQVAVINVYCPRADPEKPERGLIKIQFYQLLRERAAVIRATGVHVVIVGDINASHQPIDHCEPDPSEIFRMNPGRRFLDNFFLPVSNEGYITKDKPVHNLDGNEEKHSTEKGVPVNAEVDDSESSQDSIDFIEQMEIDVYKQIEIDIYNSTYPEEFRDQIEQIIESAVTDFQVVDTFRYFYPKNEEVFTCWNTKTNARSTNYGTRIDYVLCNPDIIPHLEDSMVLPDVQESDHCPVAATFKGTLVGASKCPLACTKYFPEFQGQQQKLLKYFMVQPKKDNSNKSKILVNNHEEKSVSSPSKPKQIKLSSFFSKDGSTVVGDRSQCKYKEALSGELDPIEKSLDECLSKKFDEDKKNKTKGSNGWDFLLRGPKPPPLCSGHKEPAVQRTVKKKGQNFNRKFYACARGAGKERDPEAQCNFFQWV